VKQSHHWNFNATDYFVVKTPRNDVVFPSLRLKGSNLMIYNYNVTDYFVAIAPRNDGLSYFFAVANHKKTNTTFLW